MLGMRGSIFFFRVDFFQGGLPHRLARKALPSPSLRGVGIRGRGMLAKRSMARPLDLFNRPPSVHTTDRREPRGVFFFGTNNGMVISSCLYSPSSGGPLFSLPLFGSLSPRPIPPPKDSLASPVQQRPCLKSLSLVPYDHRPGTFISTHPVQLGDAHAGSCERWFGSPFHWVKKLTASGLEKPPIRTMLRRAGQFQIRAPTVTKDCESLALVCVFKCHCDIIIVFLNNKLASFQVLSIFGWHPHFGKHE